MKLLLLFLISTSGFATVVPKPPTIQKLDIWGTCYFGYRCEGSPIGLGKTGAECRALGGHSLFMSNVNRCFNL